jgi:hypothetical protein
MRRTNSDVENSVIEQILELSADAQIERRRSAKDSPKFHRLSGAIVAYGKALELLTAARELEEFLAIFSGLDLPDSVSAWTH